MQQTTTLRHQRGATLVEYALVVPVFLLIVLGIMEFGHILFIQNTLANAAREGARYLVVRPEDASATNANFLAVARRLTTGLDPDELDFEVSRSSTSVTVTVNYRVDLITGPFIGAVGGRTNIPLRAVSTMRLE